MTDSDILDLSGRNQQRAWDIIRRLDIMKIWADAGAEAHVVGSLAMGLMMTHRDIDIHVYSSPLTVEGSFAAMARLAVNAAIKKIECRNLLDTDEACIEWHVWYDDGDGEPWQIDIIHILKGSRYDGFFERMAERIKAALTDETRLAILRLKAETPGDVHIMGVEYYQAVLRGGVRTMADFIRWRQEHPVTGIVEWMP
jgi:predicted nucleotidyltransferase